MNVYVVFKNSEFDGCLPPDAVFANLAEAKGQSNWEYDQYQDYWYCTDPAPRYQSWNCIKELVVNGTPA